VKNVNKKLLLTLLLAVSFVLSLQSLIISAPPQVEPTITYEGVTNNGDGSYTFEYKIYSGVPVVKRWRLYSPCFKMGGAEVSVLAKDDCEPLWTPIWTMNKADHYIEFNHESDHPFTSCKPRTYYITLYVGNYIGLPYTGLPVGNVNYLIKWPSAQDITGVITGPLCPPDFVIPEFPLGTLGILIPLAAAIALMRLYYKRSLPTTRF